MALEKSGTSGGNVTNLADERMRRSTPSSREKKWSASTPGAPAASNPSEFSDHPAPVVEDTNDQANSPTKNTRRVSNRRFDKVKVDRIKADLARGDYKINYLQVADKFIEHDRYS